MLLTLSFLCITDDDDDYESENDVFSKLCVERSTNILKTDDFYR